MNLPTSNGASPVLNHHLTSWVIALRGALTLMGCCGGLYPLLTVGIGRLAFPEASTGSLVVIQGVPVGSAFVGQPFQAPGYFHGRPSAVGFDPMSLAGSNLAPSNKALRDRARATASAIAGSETIAPATIPADLITASGSGIDPHISPEAALIQIDRITRERGLPREAVAGLVERHIEAPTAGVLGRPRINVLALNLALDRLPARSQPESAASNPPVSPAP